MKHINSDILWDYTIGELDIKPMADVKQHLQECSLCRNEYKKLSELHQELFLLTHDQPSSAFSTQVLHTITNSVQAEKSNNFWLKFTKHTLILAAAIVTITFFTMIAFQEQNLITDMDNIKELVLISSSTSFILWTFYGMDVFIKNKMIKTAL